MQYKALIVDDSKLARMVMASAFRRLRPDWELIEASNGEDAINALSSQPIDIALVDFNMPGFEKATRKCRWRWFPPTSRTRLLRARGNLMPPL